MEGIDLVACTACVTHIESRPSYDDAVVERTSIDFIDYLLNAELLTSGPFLQQCLH